MNKKGQIAMWVIIAVVLAASIIVYFAASKFTITTDQQTFNPRQIIERCVSDSVNEAADIMIPQAGLIEPKNYRLYNYTKAPYMCENVAYYVSCINQHPMLLNEIKNQIYEYIQPRIEQCFDLMKEEAAAKNIEVEIEEMTFNVSLAPDRIFVPITRKTVVNLQETSQTFNDYSIEIISPIYDMANVVLDIVNKEAKSCSFDALAYMMRYPRFNIRNTVLDDSTKIYFLKDNNTGKKTMFAIRGCAMPGM